MPDEPQEEEVQGGLMRRLAEAAAGRAGATVVESEKLGELEEAAADQRLLRKELDALAWASLDYMGGNEQDLQAVKRRRLAQQARIAWQQDAQLGAAVDLRNNFVFGRGIPKPKAHDRKVQQIIDEAWNDPDNQLILTSYQAQMALGTDLTLQSNLFILLFKGMDGRVKLGMLDHDSVENVVRDPDNRRKILYYVSRKRRLKWDFDMDQAVLDEYTRTNQDDVRYYPHWANEAPAGSEAPAEKLGEGAVYHVAVNRGSEMAFGHPRMHRVLRWATAFNSLMEARVDAAKAQAAFIMKRKVKGTPNQVRKMATQILSKSGELGRSSTDIQSGPMGGSILTENEAVEHESFNLDSGAQSANVDGQMIRSQISAGTGFPQHYLGDIGSANLATATCHDEATETLTSEGWMTLSELKARADDLPLIAAYNRDRRGIVYEKPKFGLLLHDYDGEMVRFQNDRHADMLVTPNHRMMLRRAAGDDYEMIEAGEVGNSRWQARTAAPLLEGKREARFVLPAYPAAGTRVGQQRGEYKKDRNEQIRALAAAFEVAAGTCACGCGSPRPAARLHGRKTIHAARLSGHSGHGGRDRWIARQVGATERAVKGALAGERPRRGAAPKMRPELTFPMDKWLRWLGWYIAEGSEAQVVQAEDSAWLEEVQTACRALDIPATERWKMSRGKRVWVWTPRNPKQWVAWLDENVGAGAAHKRIPGFVFGLAPDLQLELLRGLMGGDGHAPDGWETQGNSLYSTTSRQLADDVQRLAFHCGFFARTRCLSRYETKKGPREAWTVSLYAGESKRKLRDHGNLPKPTRERYKGEVYCFTLPSDTMVTRRNGVIAIHGQSMELPVLKSVESDQEVVEQMIRWFIDRVIEAAIEGGRLGVDYDDDEWAKLEEDREKEGHSEQADVATGTEALGGRDASLQLGLGQSENEDRKRDLSYEFSLPNPLRRMMGDLVNAVSTIARTFDPNGTNLELSRSLLGVALGEGLEIEDPASLVRKVFPPGYKDPAMAALQAQQAAAGGPEAPAEGETPPDVPEGAYAPPGGLSMNNSPASAEAPSNMPQPSTGSPLPEEAM